MREPEPSHTGFGLLVLQAPFTPTMGDTMKKRHEQIEWLCGRLDPDLKAAWVAALRDPSNVQARQALRTVMFFKSDSDTFPDEGIPAASLLALGVGEGDVLPEGVEGCIGRCCLGVLVDTYAEFTRTPLEWRDRLTVAGEFVPALNGEQHVSTGFLDPSFVRELPGEKFYNGFGAELAVLSERGELFRHTSQKDHQAFSRAGWTAVHLSDLNDTRFSFSQIADLVDYAL